MNTINSRVTRMAKYLLFVVVSINTSNLFSQTNNSEISEIQDRADLIFDSLITDLDNSSVDTIKINVLNDIAWNFAPTNFKKCKKFADSALVISRRINWKKGEGYALKNLGEAFRYKGDLTKSLEEHEKSLSIFQSLKDSLAIASLLSNIGISYYRLSDYANSFDYYNKALQIFLDLDAKTGIQKMNILLGVLFYDLNDYNTAIKRYKFALNFANEMNDKSSKALILGNIGNINYDWKDYITAENYYQQALELFEELNDSYNYALFLGNLGNLYLEQKLFKKALHLNNIALNYYNKTGNKLQIAIQLGNQGCIQYHMATDSSVNRSKNESTKLLKLAEDNLAISVQELNALGNKGKEIFYLTTLTDIYKYRGDYRLAFLTIENTQGLKDSLYSSKINKKISEISVSQDIKLKEKEIEILNKDNEYQKLIKKFLIIFAILLVLLLGFIYNLYKRKREHNNILEQNIAIRKDAEEALKKNEIELNKHKNNLEILVHKRTEELENEIIERKRTEKDLLVAIDRVEAANRAKSVFLENMSHELRTPLVGILGYSGLLSKEVPSKELREMADGINRTGNRLLNTLSMVLDLARIESDKFEINIAEVDVERELTQVYNNFKGAVATKNIDFSLNLSDEAKIINTDEGMFKVIIENLVNNAIKFTKEGKISIESKIDEGDLLVNVIDTGIGIKNGELSEIFKEFKQLSEGTLKDFQGTGLGLSISKKFIENLNGTLSVESEFGVGSCFTIKLPIN